MTWLTVMEYMCHKWTRISSTCRKHIQVLSSFITYHRVCTYINTTGVTNGAGTAYPSRAPELTPGFQWGSCNSIISFMCLFFKIIVCPFVRFLFAIVLSVLLPCTRWYHPTSSQSFSTDTDYYLYLSLAFTDPI